MAKCDFNTRNGVFDILRMQNFPSLSHMFWTFLSTSLIHFSHEVNIIHLFFFKLDALFDCVLSGGGGGGFDLLSFWMSFRAQITFITFLCFKNKICIFHLFFSSNKYIF